MNVGATWPANAALQVEELSQKYEVRGRAPYYVMPVTSRDSELHGPFDSYDAAEEYRTGGLRDDHEKQGFTRFMTVEGSRAQHQTRALGEFTQDLRELVDRWSNDDLLPRDVREQYVEHISKGMYERGWGPKPTHVEALHGEFINALRARELLSERVEAIGVMQPEYAAEALVGYREGQEAIVLGRIDLDGRAHEIAGVMLYEPGKYDAPAMTILAGDDPATDGKGFRSWEAPRYDLSDDPERVLKSTYEGIQILPDREQVICERTDSALVHLAQSARGIGYRAQTDKSERFEPVLEAADIVATARWRYSFEVRRADAPTPAEEERGYVARGTIVAEDRGTFYQAREREDGTGRLTAIDKSILHGRLPEPGDRVAISAHPGGHTAEVINLLPRIEDRSLGHEREVVEVGRA